MRRLLILLALLSLPSVASAREGWRDWCWNGAKRVTTSGLNSTTTVQATTASCTVTIYQHGGSTLATIYSDNNNTPLANPFTGSNPNGQFIWYADNGRYDQTINVLINGTSNTVTMSDILLCDPYVVGSTCNNGGSTTAHNLLSTTHLDTIPASPPTRGDLITAQNQTSPSSVTPSWARLPLGTAGQVVLSNGLDAIWGNIVAGSNITVTNTGSPAGSTITITATAGGTGCTLPSIDTAVLSEHPAGTCYDSTHFTWDDGASKQNLQAGSGFNSFLGTSHDDAIIGNNISDTDGDENFLVGDNHVLIGASSFDQILGRSNTITALQNSVVLGQDNIVDHANDNMVFGFSNTIQPATPNTGQNVVHTFVMGQDNNVQSITGSNGIKQAVVVGFSNLLTNANTTGGSSREMLDIFVAGTGNSLTQNSNNLLQFVHVMGTDNIVANTLADTQEVEIVGEQNTVDGALSTLQILGFKNVAHNVSSQSTLTVNTTIVGSANAVTNTGNSGANAYQGVFGGLNTLQNCVGCWIVGENVTNSTNATLAIGMSSTPEIVITSQNVTYRPIAFGSLGTPANGTLIYCNDCTIANPCASGGSGAFAKRLNGVWVCN